MECSGPTNRGSPEGTPAWVPSSWPESSRDGIPPATGVLRVSTQDIAVELVTSNDTCTCYTYADTQQESNLLHLSNITISQEHQTSYRTHKSNQQTQNDSGRTVTAQPNRSPMSQPRELQIFRFLIWNGEYWPNTIFMWGTSVVFWMITIMHIGFQSNTDFIIWNIIKRSY